MRVNVYAEELTDEIKCLQKTGGTGARYFGLHFYLRSPKELHANTSDDDRSAVILWKKDRQDLLDLLSKAIEAVKNSK